MRGYQAEIRKELPGAGGLTTKVVKGSPKEAIVEEAEQWGADLIVMGSHGYGFWQRALLGSVSESVVHHAPCSVLVVPRPDGPPAAYGHLAAFVRQAPERQKHDLWPAVAAAMKARIGGDPVWLSTAGAGVPWLHVRLDNSPKYYGHRPYAQG